MNVLVLGAAGDMGSRAAKELLSMDSVKSVTILDKNIDLAKSLFADHPKATIKHVDVRDHESLVAVMKGHDVVASAVGPFYLFEPITVRAAIDAKVHYVSICDDHDACSKVLALDHEARENGISVVTGAGWTPGITNAAVRYAADLLGDLEEVHIAWGGSAGDSKGYAVILHTIHIFTGMVPSVIRGTLTQVPAGSEGEWVEFPVPLGRVQVFNVGHPEPLTVSKYLPNVKRVTLKGGLVEGYLTALARFLPRIGLTNTPGKKAALGNFFHAILPALEKFSDKSCNMSGFLVRVRAVSGARVTLAGVGHMADLTGIPLAIVAEMVGNGTIKRKGVFAPEAQDGVPASRFFDELGKRGIRLFVSEY
ncbi:MAG: saccharopine dehydrogenase family protein [Bacillota bacterium]